MCSEPGCSNRYTHANRQCPDHPYAKPQRSAEIILQPTISGSEDRDQVVAWLEKYKREKEDKTPGKFQPETPETPETAGYAELKRNRSKRGLAEEMEQCIDQENWENKPAINDRTMVAKQTLSQALQRAGERMENQAIQRLVPSPVIKTEEPLTYLPVLTGPRILGPSPMKKPVLDQQSPLKGIRRTLGDITPTKNCRTDQYSSDLDLPFNFGLPTSPAFCSDPLLRTPIPAEKYLCSPTVQGSPALKLKKRFQERFQEEKHLEREELLAKPILWTEDEFLTPVKQCYSSSPSYRKEFSSPLSSSFSSPGRETSSPTLLVAAALVELQGTTREDIPLNLTKNK